MRTFLIRTTIFLLPLALLLIGMEFLLRRIPNDYSYKNDRIIHAGASITTLILGNSHAYKGIEPDSMGHGGFSMANISQDLRYDHAILDRYLPYLPGLEHIVLPISYGSLGAELEHGRESWRVKNYALYMGINQYASGLEQRTELLNRPIRDQVSMLKRYYLRGKDNRVCTPSGAGTQRRQKDLDLDRSGREAAARHRRREAGSIARSKAELDAIVRIAEERGIALHLVTAPGWRSYRDAMDADQLKSVIAHCEHIDSSRTTVDYTNLLDDERFTESDFADADHLSIEGQAKFSRILAGIVRGDR